MKCPTCNSCSPDLHPCKQAGKIVPHLFVSLEQDHSHDGAPVTIALCNNDFHLYEGKLCRADTPISWLDTPRPPLTESQDVLLSYLKGMVQSMRAGGLKTAEERIRIWNVAIATIEVLTQQAWPE